MSHPSLVATLVIVFAAQALAQSEGAPKERCPFQGFATTFPLATTTRATDGWVLCPPGAGCRTSPLKAGEPVVVYSVEGAWTCAGLPGGPGWVRSSELRTVAPEPAPTLNEWVGTWNGGAGRVTLQRAKTSGVLTIAGHGSWEGGNGVRHTGTFAGDATPSGNRMHFSDGYCAIDLALIGRYILADDNGQCGGLNVRFSGIWTRTTTAKRK